MRTLLLPLDLLVAATLTVLSRAAARGGEIEAVETKSDARSRALGHPGL